MVEEMTTKIKNIGIIGAGQMGSGISHVCIVAGYDVRLIDVDEGALSKARAAIEKNLSRQVRRERLTEADMKAALEHLSMGTDSKILGDCDLVIEAATENEETKKAIFANICPDLKDDAILATNTSSISITLIAAATQRPDKVVGMHFFNPVPLMKLVEIVRGLATSDQTTATAVALSEALGKTLVETNDSPGFISNRILCPMLNEAIYALMEGVGTPEAIDAVMKLGMNHPMGPLELCDLVGIDVLLHVMEVLHRDLGEDKYRPCPLLRKMVAAGRLGRKTGRGFHEYA